MGSNGGGGGRGGHGHGYGTGSNGPMMMGNGDRNGGHHHHPPYEQSVPQNGETFQQFLDRRREIREKSTLSIWPPSPDVARNDSPSPRRDGKRASRRDRERSVDSAAGSSSRGRRDRKRRRDDSASDGSDVGSVSESSEEDDSRRRRKRSSSRKHKSSNSSSKKSKKKKSSSSKKKRARSPTPSSASESAPSDKDDRAVVAVPIPASTGSAPVVDDTVEDYWREKAVEAVEDAPVGPMPLNVAEAKHDDRAYGGALLAGEGSAMAAYLQSGKRIPRRGEIGLTSNEIENYEDVGFVMSGNRHRRMNAVRIRKENQVISAEEKRALLLFSQE
ncbi:hypothetical protein HKX48_003211, partial [Thoreauomyces humboldtii]